MDTIPCEPLRNRNNRGSPLIPIGYTFPPIVARGRYRYKRQYFRPYLPIILSLYKGTDWLGSRTIGDKVLPFLPGLSMHSGKCIFQKACLIN
uniref:Uncharacterized protein n=1 Tax=Picea glauca TaxID=3330 RepID=A0A117NH00_PICGL|nr:hypothetical protein ABT39_MTgene5728 [Picea glauca]QHR90660.1 hypothetical protein Q903MT_gene4685 [Picea sitchensis]